MLSVIYKTVSYLPSDSYQQLGLFAKAEILKGSIVKGVIGFLAEIKENEVVEGFNDMSVIYSKLKGIQWIMLGPISFINASCNAIVEYKQIGKIVCCVERHKNRRRTHRLLLEKLFREF